MKQCFLLTISILFIAGCTLNNPQEEKSSPSDNDNIIVPELLYEEEKAGKLAIEPWVDPDTLDTSFIFKRNFSVTIRPAKSIEMQEYPIDDKITDSVTRGVTNSEKQATAIETYLFKKYGDRVKKSGQELAVKLRDGNWKKLIPDPETEEAGLNFEHYFEKTGYYSIRTQWYEGNAYKVVNEKNGHVTDVIGRPFFSENGKFMLSVNADIDAHYSDNGFQVFLNRNDSLEYLGSWKPEAWGVIAAKWISNNTAILKCETFGPVDNTLDYTYFYLELAITKN